MKELERERKKSGEMDGREGRGEKEVKKRISCFTVL